MPFGQKKSLNISHQFPCVGTLKSILSLKASIANSLWKRILTWNSIMITSHSIIILRSCLLYHHMLRILKLELCSEDMLKITHKEMSLVLNCLHLMDIELYIQWIVSDHFSTQLEKFVQMSLYLKTPLSLNHMLWLWLLKMNQ